MFLITYSMGNSNIAEYRQHTYALNPPHQEIRGVEWIPLFVSDNFSEIGINLLFLSKV